MKSPLLQSRSRSRLSVLLGSLALPLILAPACLAQNPAIATAAHAPALPSIETTGGLTSNVSRIGAGGDTLHLVVGHSIFLNTRSRLKRVYVADPTVVTSMTLSPSQIVVTAMTPGVSSLVLVDENGQGQSYVVSSDLDVQGLRSAMSEAMRSDIVHVEGNGARVTLSGTVSTEALSNTAFKIAGLYAKDVANSLNIVPAHARQVRLKVRILEVDRSKVTQFGINIFNPSGNYAGAGTTSQFPTTATVTNQAGQNTLTISDPLNYLFYDWKYNIGATVKDLENKQVLQILAEPTITTISGEKANFLAGGEFPFPVIQPGGGGSTSSSVTIQFRPYGVKLEFTPIVNDDGTIRLKVAPEVSALDYTNAVTISGYTIPALATRKAETQVELRSDQSFAISGLLDKRTTDAYSKTPGVASIPIIGQLFKSKNINHTNSELIVIVTPTLVDPLSDTTAPETPNFPVKTMDTGKFDTDLNKSAARAEPVTVPEVSAPSVQATVPAPTPTPALALPVDPAATAAPAAPTAPEAPAAPSAVPSTTQTPQSPIPAAPGPVSTAWAPAATPSIIPPAPSVAAPATPRALPALPLPVAKPAPAAATAPAIDAPGSALAPTAPTSAVTPPAPRSAAAVETPVVETPVQTPAVQAAAITFKAEAPKPAAPRVEAPRVEAPRVEAPKVQAMPEPKPEPKSGAKPDALAAPRPAPQPSEAPLADEHVAEPAPAPAPSPKPSRAPSAPAPVQSAAAQPQPSPAADATVGAQPFKPFQAAALRPVPVGGANAASAQAVESASVSMVQIMAVTHQEDADTMVVALKREGYDVAISRQPQDTLLHLQVGPFNSPTDAEAIRNKLVVEGYNAKLITNAR